MNYYMYLFDDRFVQEIFSLQIFQDCEVYIILQFVENKLIEVLISIR